MGAVIVSSVVPEPFPPGAEQRIADFAELAAQALANAQARADLAASRRASSRPATPNGGGSSATSTTVRSSGSSAGVDAAAGRAPAPGRRRARARREELSHALKELHELARGVHPAVLTERGLEPAVRALADRAPLR